MNSDRQQSGSSESRKMPTFSHHNACVSVPSFIFISIQDTVAVRSRIENIISHFRVNGHRASSLLMEV